MELVGGGSVIKEASSIVHWKPIYLFIQRETTEIFFSTSSFNDIALLLLLVD